MSSELEENGETFLSLMVPLEIPSTRIQSIINDFNHQSDETS